jgi:hypothetical protein
MPPGEGRTVAATPLKPHRGGWFSKCQQVCEAVLANNIADARLLATMHYAGPAANVAG